MKPNSWVLRVSRLIQWTNSCQLNWVFAVMWSGKVNLIILVFMMCAVELYTAIDGWLHNTKGYSTVFYLLMIIECLRYHKPAPDTMKKATEPHRRTCQVSQSHSTLVFEVSCHYNRTTQSGLWSLVKLLNSMDLLYRCFHFLLSGSSSHPVLGTMITASIIPVSQLCNKVPHSLLTSHLLSSIVEVMANPVEPFLVQAIQVASECYFVRFA